jgi:alcohol dehydrogenase class IV
LVVRMPPELTSRAGQDAMLGCIGSHYTGNADGNATGDAIDPG